VSAIAPETILAVFAIFCRVGACLIIAPGFSAAQVPAKIRLFIALAASLALSPMLIDDVKPALGDGSAPVLLKVIFSELATGLFIGFIARLLFMALQMITTAMTQAIGLSALPGTVMDDQDQAPALSTLFSIAVTTLMFATGLHIELMRGLVDSYTTIPPALGFSIRPVLSDIADKAGAAFVAALRIGSPFIIYSVVVNFAIGVTNKLVPQIPVFFIATPFVMLGGLFLLLLTSHDFLNYFVLALDTWLGGG
jgi:flagellar biosynthetic protein FliR